jgi:hypothetical protein
MALFGKRNKSKDNQEHQQATIDQVLRLYRNAYADKEELHNLWDECFKAYDGSLFKGNRPDYAVNEISNHVFSTVETIKPIMLAQIPKIIALPKKNENFDKAEAIQQALDYEWKRTQMFSKLHSALTIGTITGTFIISLIWDGAEDGIGQIKPVVISPFNFFIDPMATSLKEAEYAGYAAYITLGQAIQFAPDKAEELKKAASSPDDQWLTYGKDTSNAQNNYLLYIEMYFRDYSTVMEDETDDDGNTVQVTKLKYPKGRRVILAGDVLLSDGENPYEDGKFPFVAWRCYKQSNKFWGMGEVQQIISPQKYANEVINVILDNARLMANQVWILDKNSGVAKNSLTNRPGLVVRKNPGTEVKRDAPPSMPAYLQNIAQLLREDIEHISGVYDVTRGERPTGITAAAAIQALNEQSQGRIKLKVQELEEDLSELGAMWVSRMKQFWEAPRTIRIMDDNYIPSYVEITRDMIDGDWDIIVSAGSTMPVNKAARFEQLIRLSQTVAEDGLPMVDRQTMLENSELPDVKAILQRFEAIKMQQQEQAMAQAQMQQEQAVQQQQMDQQMQMEQARQKQALQLEADQIKSSQAMEMEQMKQQGAMQMEQIRMAGQQTEEQPQGTELDPRLLQLIQIILQMDPDQVAQLVEQHPEIQELLDILAQIEQPEQGLEGGME